MTTKGNAHHNPKQIHKKSVTFPQYNLHSNGVCPTNLISLDLFLCFLFCYRYEICACISEEINLVRITCFRGESDYEKTMLTVSVMTT